ncbi:MAG: histidine triad nucleotide-binding protein [Syntrophales bacterium]
MEDCIFCKIVKGRIPSTKVYEDDFVLAFDDIHPMAPVHVIIIPKVHIPTFMDVKGDLQDNLTAMVKASIKIAGIKGVDKRGFRVVINYGKEGGQVIFHLHMHLLGGRRLDDEMG